MGTPFFLWPNGVSKMNLLSRSASANFCQWARTGRRKNNKLNSKESAAAMVEFEFPEVLFRFQFHGPQFEPLSHLPHAPASPVFIIYKGTDFPYNSFHVSGV